jgi:hypothetical protein
MTGKGLWLGSLLAVAVASAVTTRLVADVPTVAAPAASSEVDALGRRLARLEAERVQSGRAFAQAAAQPGAGALLEPATGQGPVEAAAEEQEQAAQQEVSQKEREGRHYDDLDRQVRGSGGGAAAAAAAQLRSNLQGIRHLPADKGEVELDVVALDCGEKLCRLELKGGTTGNPSLLIPQLLQGMGANLSMRPASAGRAIYYIAAHDQQLPSPTP